jgi:hypothetical protein
VNYLASSLPEDDFSANLINICKWSNVLKQTRVPLITTKDMQGFQISRKKVANVHSDAGKQGIL